MTTNKINHDQLVEHCAQLNNVAARAEFYNKRFPGRPGLHYSNGMVVGTWMIGACYKNPNRLYGAYPYGYLDRVHAMFPDAQHILHVFSGGMTLAHAISACGILAMTTEDGQTLAPGFDCQGRSWELVDMHGPEQGRHPTWQGDLHKMPEEWAGRFDLILADPPYSAADSIKYDCPTANRGKVMRSLHRVAKKGANLVWLDQVWPMHKKTMWKTWGTIGLLRSTNHRVRMVTCFEAQ